jgi:hypothetical protein
MKLLIEEAAYQKIRAYTDLCPNEISGLGKVRVEHGDFIVSDVAIFEQKVSAAHSTIEPAALAKFQDERVKAGESMREWKLWWHSHAEMGVFFSKTDTDTIDGSTEFPWLVSLVVNKKRESEARIDVFEPVHMFMELDVEIISEANDEIKKLCEADIKEKVEHPKKHVGYDWRDWGKKDKKGGIQPTNLLLPPYSANLEDEVSSTGGFRDLKSIFQEQETEYRDHKIYLLKRIKKARKKRHQLETDSLIAELMEHIQWGKSQGFEITKAGAKDDERE